MDQGQLLSDCAAKEHDNSSASLNHTAKFLREEQGFMGPSPIPDELVIGSVLSSCCTNSHSGSELMGELAR